MKIKFMNALNSAPKLLCTVALSGFLVACGGGSGDGTDDGIDGGVDTGTTDAAGDDGFSTLDLGDDGGTDTTGDAGFIDPLTDDSDGNGIPDVDENLVCKGLGGSDPDSRNAEWNDNCWLQQTINDGANRSPFFFSYYTMGVQRVLFCQGHGVGVDDTLSTVDALAAFSDGDFGPNTNTAVRDFQEAEGLGLDGIVGDETWGRLQELVETGDFSTLVTSDEQYDAYGIDAVALDSTINCEGIINFFGRLNTDADAVETYEGWELARTPGMSDRVPFSTERPQ